jgi:hypothetical protein
VYLSASSIAIAQGGAPEVTAHARSAKQIVDVYAGGNFTVIDNAHMAIMFDVDNRDPERAATVDATCIIHYDQAQRFLLQSTPTAPDTISGTLMRSDDRFQVMWPGQNTGYLMFNKGNATIDHIECKVDKFEMLEESFVITLLKKITSVF